MKISSFTALLLLSFTPFIFADNTPPEIPESFIKASYTVEPNPDQDPNPAHNGDDVTLTWKINASKGTYCPKYKEGDEKPETKPLSNSAIAGHGLIENTTFNVIQTVTANSALIKFSGLGVTTCYHPITSAHNTTPKVDAYHTCTLGPRDPTGGGGQPGGTTGGGGGGGITTTRNTGGGQSTSVDVAPIDRSTQCTIRPFVPSIIPPFENLDRRTANNIVPASRVEIVAENLSTGCAKHGWWNYNYVKGNIPKVFSTESIRYQLHGGEPTCPWDGYEVNVISKEGGHPHTIEKTGRKWYLLPGYSLPLAAPKTETTYTRQAETRQYPYFKWISEPIPYVITQGPVAFETYTYQLSNEYTTDQFKTYVIDRIFSFKGAGFYYPEKPTACYVLSEDETYLSYAKTKYKIRIPADVPLPYKATWLEIFSPEDTNLTDTIIPDKIVISKSEEIFGSESQVYEIDPKSTPNKEGTWEVLLVQAAVDADRNGKIEYGSDQTTAVKPFRFWVNDDRDIENEPDPGEKEEDDMKDLGRDSAQPGLEYRRDLEDLTRLWINLKDSYPRRNYDVKVRIKPTQGNPKITLFRPVEADGGIQYLKDEAKGLSQIQGIYKEELCRVTGSSSVIVSSLWQTMDSK